MRVALLFTALLFIQPAMAGERVFTFDNESEPETIDPGLMTGIVEARIAGSLFEGLCRLDPATLEARPGMAASWTVSADGLDYRFQLREGLRWSDGSPLSAAEIRASWLRILDPKTAAAYAYQLYPIAGAEAIHAGKAAPDSLAVSAPDERTLAVRLHTPCAYFLQLCAFHTLFPVPVQAIARHGEAWTQPGHLIGNGAFRLVAWEPRRQIVMERNPFWHGAAEVQLDRIVARPYDDADAAWRLYLAGRLDWVPRVPPARQREAIRHPDYYCRPYSGTYFYRFNCSKPPFDDARVRRALALATDRGELTRFVLRGGQVPSGAFVPPMPGYRPVAGLPYDPAAARALLLEAGWGPQRPLPEIEILYNTSENHRAIAEAVAQQWQTALGLRVRLRNAEWKVYLSEMDALRFELCRSAWIGDYPDPNSFLDLFVTGGGNNRTGWASPAFDALLRASQREGDPAKREALLQHLERQLVEVDCPILPVYTYVAQGLLNPRIQGWTFNVLDHHDFATLRIGD